LPFAFMAGYKMLEYRDTNEADCRARRRIAWFHSRGGYGATELQPAVLVNQQSATSKIMRTFYPKSNVNMGK